MFNALFNAKCNRLDEVSAEKNIKKTTQKKAQLSGWIVSIFLIIGVSDSLPIK